MNKEYWKNQFKQKFKWLPNEFKLICYRNPNEFIWFNLERVNPNHIINILGIPKKKYRKGCKLKYYRVGKIILCIYAPLLSFSFISEYIIAFLYYTSIFYLTICFMCNILEMENRHLCLLESKENLVVAKHY